MRKTLLTAIMVLMGATAFAQTGPGFGIKGGLNYGANGDYFDSAEDAYENPDGNVGYHIGVFGKLGNRIYLRPEIVYTKMKSDYGDGSFDMSKLDVPLLVGIKVIGPLHVFAGPAFQYILDTDFDDVTLGDVENDFTVGMNLGAGVNLGKLGIDLRYERGLSSNEIDFGDVNQNRIDTRPDQLILSLSLTL
ncbi:MAG: porin family protein [Sediminicola sp.]|tara:strand:+ start:14295 stop:14867 length:573 start_codon:yes stop_codon:yes gene_type:complete